jgi:dolichol-phosphate mannosyltransferase
VASSHSVLVAVATFNERDNLRDLLAAIRRELPTADILVTDDGSPDGTGLLADALAAKDPRVQVRHRPGKLGLGTAQLAALRHAIEHNYDFVITMDADLSHDPRYLPALLAGMADHDVMIGSRYVAGGEVVNWPRSRRCMSKMANALTRRLLDLQMHDTSGGFRCYRVELLRRVSFDDFLSHGYSYLQEVLYRCVLAGARVGETPIVFSNRRAGRSKVGVCEIVGSLTTLYRLWRAGGASNV